jgi:hypothetical protein
MNPLNLAAGSIFVGKVLYTNNHNITICKYIAYMTHILKTFLEYAPQHHLYAPVHRYVDTKYSTFTNKLFPWNLTYSAYNIGW